MDKAFLLDPTHFVNFRRKGDIYMYKGDLVKAEEEYQKLLNLREPVAQAWGNSRLAYLYLLKGKFEEAKKLSKQGVELSKKFGQSLWESMFNLSSAYLHQNSGNPEIALRECDEAWKSGEKADFLFGQKLALYAKASVFLKMKQMPEARNEAERLKEMIEKGLNKKEIRMYYHLMGMMELEKGNFGRAVRYFEDTLALESYGPLAKSAEFINSLALAYYRSGNLEKALENYQWITTLTTGRLGFGDIYAKSFYMLGKIHEEKGLKEKASEYYEKFLALWKDADSGIPEVIDAKNRLK